MASLEPPKVFTPVTIHKCQSTVSRDWWETLGRLGWQQSHHNDILNAQSYKLLSPFLQSTQESPSRLSKTYHLNGTNLDWGTQLSILISIMYSNRLIIISPSPDHWLLRRADHKVRRSIRDFSRDFFIASSAVQFVVAKVFEDKRSWCFFSRIQMRQ